MEKASSQECPYPGCFFCVMKEGNPNKRRSCILKFFRDLPSQDDDGQVLPISGLWNTAMAHPNDPEFIDLGIFECMSALIWKGLKNRRWLSHDQNIYIPYYAAHIIGSYTMNMEEFAERAVEAGVIPPLVELLRGRLTWVEQRVAVRALGHLATYPSTFSSVASHGEILELAIQLGMSSLEIVYSHFYQFPDRRLSYHCDLLTRGMGGVEMESRKAEEWASQLQCWSLQLINCFAFKSEFLPALCKPEFLVSLPVMWGGLVNENSPAGIGLLRTICQHKLGRGPVSSCSGMMEALCNIARSSDDWQYMAIECLLWLLQDPNTSHKVVDKAVPTLVDLAEITNLGDHKKLGDSIVSVLQECDSVGSRSRELIEETVNVRQRLKWEKSMPKEDLHIKQAAALVVKLEGNSLFSSGDIAGAAEKYSEALSLCPMRSKKDKDASTNSKKGSETLELFDVARFYSCMLRIFCVLNPVVGPLPVLNMLSFSPGYIVSLWSSLENVLLSEDGCIPDESSHKPAKASWNTRSPSEKKLKHVKNDGVNKWVNVLNKFSGKSPGPREHVESTSDQPGSSLINDSTDDGWDVQTLRGGPVGISKDVSCLLHLFCATYAHLLVVLDDIQFYEKQVPFMLEKQRRIASVLNTLVYNGLLRGTGPENRQLMDSAIRCLHLLYERDCRHPFCPSTLWLSPGRTSRPPIAFAARTHEVLPTSDVFTSPSMGSVITITPHVFPFEERVHVFREFISMDKASRKMAGEVDAPGARSIEIVVRRGHVVEDGFRQLNSIGSRLKSSIHVSFVNESGLPEAGLDYGGLSKEFLTDITKAAFASEYGLFSQTTTSDRLLVPSPSARYLENGIQMIEFLGRIVGKALYEGILLDYSFSHVFIQKLLGRYSFIDELSGLDPELYRNLMYIKQYEGDLQELCLDFTVTEEFCGKMSIIELKPGGKDISVTNENKMQYIHAMADYKLNRQIVPFSNAFYRGLTDLISPAWLKLFNAHEFNQLLSGGNHDIDVDDLRRNTKYTGGYSDSSRTIKIFWEVMKGFEPSERCMLLKFVTSCSRAPLLGFKYLQPTFIIHKVSCDTSLWAAIGGQDVERLPSASTCYNTLKLPTYKRASTMREKLLYAITSNAGFELS